MKVFIKIIIPFVLVCILIMCFLFSNNENSDYSSVYISNIHIGESKFQAQAVQNSSGKSFTGYDYKTEEDCLYLTLYSKIADKRNHCSIMYINIQDDLSNLKKVYLTDGCNLRLIFPAN